MSKSECVKSQLASLDEMLAGLQDEAAALSLPAVMGDKYSASRIGAISVEIDHAKAGRAILETALAQAIEQEADDAREAAEAQRELHMLDARTYARKLLQAAACADEIVLEFKIALADLSNTEIELRRALSAARALPGEGVVGRQNISQMAAERMMAALRGTDRFQTDKSKTANVALVAWRFLLDDDAPRGTSHGVSPGVDPATAAVS